jgi:hypothetical protein
VYVNTRGIILLEYGISLTQWPIILTLYDDGCRLTKSMLSHVTQLLTHHPLNAALQPSHNEEMCPLVYCITNQYVHPCRAWLSLVLDRTEVRSAPVPAKMCYCMGRLFLCVSRMSQIPKIGYTLLGISQVHRNTLRYTNVILFRILITSDDGTSGKTNTFTHQVTIQTAPLRQARMAFTVRPDFCSAWEIPTMWSSSEKTWELPHAR